MKKFPMEPIFWPPKKIPNFPWMRRIITLPLSAGARWSKYGYFDYLYNPVYTSDSILRGLSEALITNQSYYLPFFPFDLVGNFESLSVKVYDTGRVFQRVPDVGVLQLYFRCNRTEFMSHTNKHYAEKKDIWLSRAWTKYVSSKRSTWKTNRTMSEYRLLLRDTRKEVTGLLLFLMLMMVSKRLRDREL